jgi:hypothetical protein
MKPKLLKQITSDTFESFDKTIKELHNEGYFAGRGTPLFNGKRLAEVPHSRNFGFEQEFSCGILANRCYAYVPTCLAGISFGTRIEIFN